MLNLETGEAEYQLAQPPSCVCKKFLISRCRDGVVMV